MQTLCKCFAGTLLATTFSVAAQAQAAADEWFLKHDLFSIPVTRQSEAQPGTLIALLPNGDIQWLHPAEVTNATPMAFTVFTSESKEAVQAGVIAKFLSLGLAGQVKNSSILTIQQTEFKGTGYLDGPRENIILKKNTSVTDQFEKIQDDFSKENRDVPIYLIQKVFTTADLEVTNGRNILVSGSVNSTTPGSCTDVTVGAGAGAGAGTGSGAGAGAGSGAGTGSGAGAGTGSGAGAGTGSGAGAGATLPGGGALFCYGRGGKDTLKANHEVPVAMSVCNVYWWEDDKSWNCRPALKSLHF